jgi:hypothetical protein
MGGGGRDWGGNGGEMALTLYSHMNKIKLFLNIEFLYHITQTLSTRQDREENKKSKAIKLSEVHIKNVFMTSE